MSGYESYDDEKELNAGEKTALAGDVLGRQDGKDIVAESYDERIQLFEDQIGMGELTDYEIPIEKNVYGGLVILLMIDKSQFDTWLAQEVEEVQNAADAEECDEWIDKCVHPDDTLWRDIGAQIGQAVLCMVSMYIQFLFGFYMLEHISEDEYEEKIGGTTENPINIFQEWNLQNPDMKEAICGGSQVVFQEDLADSLSKYASLATLLGQPISRGLMFGILSIAVWAAVVMENFRRALDFFMLAALPCKSGSLILKGHGTVMRIVIILMALFRMVIQIMIAWYGILFLAHTDNLQDFILNSIALEFIYQIPEKMYNAFSSTRTHNWVDVASESAATKKIFARELPAWFKIFNGAIYMFIGGGSILWYGVSVLSPFDKRLTNQVFGQLCAGTVALSGGDYISSVKMLR